MLAIPIAAVTLASDSTITIARFRPSKAETITKLFLETIVIVIFMCDLFLAK